MKGFVAGFILLYGGNIAGPQAVRVGGVKPQLTVGNNLTVTCPTTTLTFALTPGGVSVAPSGLSVTTTWTGVSLVASLNIYAYFASSTAALTGGSPSTSIPSSVIFGQVPTGTPTSYTAFNQTGPFGGASGSLLLVSTGALVSLGGSRTDVLTLKIDLSSMPQLPAASYTGTLYLQAQEF